MGETVHIHCKQEGSIAEVKQGVKNLEQWQQSQNGAIHRVEDDIKKMATKEDVGAVSNKVDSLIFWMMITAVGVVLGFITGSVIIAYKLAPLIERMGMLP